MSFKIYFCCILILLNQEGNSFTGQKLWLPVFLHHLSFTSRRQSSFAEGWKVPPKKKKSHLKLHQLSPRKTFTPTKNYISFTLPCLIYAIKVFKMTRAKLVIGRLLLISICWYQSTNRRYICSHLFIYSYKGGFTISLLVKPPLWECISELGNYI